MFKDVTHLGGDTLQEMFEAHLLYKTSKCFPKPTYVPSWWPKKPNWTERIQGNRKYRFYIYLED